MKIHYIEKEGKKLFSFFTHDYQVFPTGEFIDGGFSYIRTNTEIHEDHIENIIADIRKQFTWTALLNKDGSLRESPKKQLLKELTTDHIINIIKHLSNYIVRFDYKMDDIRLRSLCTIIHIMSCELEFRYKNQNEKIT